MARKTKGFLERYKYEIIISLSILFFIILLIFHKQINKWLKDKEEFRLFSLSPVQTNSGKGKYPLITKKHESKCREIFESLLGRQFPSARPQFMKRKNGYCLELDGYNKELKLAFEYNGSQHYKFNPRFHRQMKDFDEQKVRDIDKVELCRQNSITLITIPYTVKYADLESYIRNSLVSLGYLHL